MPASNWPLVASWPGATAWPSGTSWPSGYYPPPAASPTFWLDARLAGYTDAGKTTPAVAPAGRVLRIPSGGGIAGDWSGSALSVSPFREPSALWVADNAGLVAPAITLPAQGCTMGLAGTTLDGPGQTWNGTLVGIDGGTTPHGIGFYGGVLVFWYGGNPGLFVSTGLTPLNGSNFVAVARWTSTTVDYKVLVNGVTTTSSASVSVAAGSVTAIGMGAGVTALGSDSLPLSGAMVGVAQAIGYPRVLSDAERDAVFSEFSGYSPMVYPTSAPLAVGEGDSIMAGLYIEPRGPKATYSALHNLWATYPSLRMAVPAVSGNTIALMNARYPTTTKPLYSSSRAKNILVVACGTNDFAAAGAGASAATTKTALWAYCDTAKADGWLVIPATMLPRGFQVAQFETQRAIFNTAVRAEWAGRGYAALYDEAAVAGMGASGDELNLTNYPDQTHPSATGAALLRPALQSALATALL